MRARQAILCLAFVGGLGVAAGCGDADIGAGIDNLEERPDCGVVYAEPNDQEARAVRLESTNDCDGNGSGADGVLAGAGDADWFYYEGYDVGYCRVNPTIDLAASSGVRVCTFFACVEGSADLTCPDGTTAAESETGLPGCCGTGAFNVGELNCVGTGYDAADVFVRVDRFDGDNACSDYSFEYHF